MWDPYAEFESTVLPNGLSVHVAQWPNRPWVASSVLIHSGARLDQPNLEGTAHFVEHLCSRNALIPYQEIKDYFDGLGGGVRLGATGWNYTFYDFFAPVANLDRALEIFGSMLVTAKLENFVEVQREVILGEYQRSNKLQIETEMKWRTRKSIFGVHWFARSLSPLGSPESIRGISQQDLQLHYDTHYTPANMSVVIVGGISLTQAVDLLKRSPFGIQKGGSRASILPGAEDFILPSENRFVFEFSKYVTLEKPLQTGHYESTVALPGAINERALYVTKSMLYQVLFEELREKRGWTYQVGVSQSNFQDFRLLVISASALNLSSIDTVEQVVEGCISSLAEREDLMRKEVQERINAYTMVDLTGKKLCSNAREDLQDEGRVISLAEEAELYREITMNDVRSVIKRLSSEHRRTVLTVP